MDFAQENHQNREKILDGNDRTEFPLVHDGHKPAECLKKENSTIRTEGDSEGPFDSTFESHEEFVEDVSVFNESLFNISLKNSTSQNLEDKVSNYVTSMRTLYIFITFTMLSAFKPIINLP